MENVYYHHHAHGEEDEENSGENVHENLWFRCQWYSMVLQSWRMKKRLLELGTMDRRKGKIVIRCLGMQIPWYTFRILEILL